MRRSRKRKSNLRLLIIILLIVLSIYFVQKINKNQMASNKNNGVNTLENENIVIPKDETIDIAVIGDIMCHNSQYIDAYDKTSETYDFSYVFDDIKQYIESADFAIGNLETTLAGNKIAYSGYPTFNTPEVMATDLKELGVDLVSTTNNHCVDKGLIGIENTIDELDKVGLLHTGTYKSEAESNKLLTVDVKGIKIGVVAYTYGTNGLPTPNEYSVNLISDEKIISDLSKMKEKNVDLTIAIMHWGEEYQTSPNKEQDRLANLLFENGVDIILGGHPHVLQKMEKREITLEDGSKKDGFIIYSLGNFISGQVKENTKQSVILNLQVTKHAEGDKKISIDSANYVPIYMYDKKEGKRFKLLDIEKEINDYDSGKNNISSSLYNTLKSELNHIYKIVGDEIH